MKRAALALTVLAVCAPASAYYHFIHYLPSGNAPEKFDLSALPSKTVTFFVSENGPAAYSANDSFNSVLGQVRQATQVWNGVATSDLRVAFGGLENGASLQNTPGADVIFTDLPPGLEGYGSVTTSTTPVTAPNGTQFFPIVRATVQMSRDLTAQPGPSYRETFFTTLIHEMGHALGLQHTFTSAAMSQSITRATTLSHAITADDMAAISVLYPNAAFAQLGSISGHVKANGFAAHLTSVVAIRADADAVSAMTSPDGSYRIDGLAPGSYLVYAHPLPPDADIQGPWNADGSVNAASSPTNALFYPGATDPNGALPVAVQSGKVSDSINIGLATRSFVPLYDVEVFGYFNNNTIAVQPAFIDMTKGTAGVSAVGQGLGANGKAPGLGVQILGSSAYILNNGILPAQANGSTYVGLYVGFNAAAGTGRQHVVFTTPDYMYVLPAAFSITRRQPPTVTSVSNNGDGTVTVAGTNWASDTLIYFDSLPATISSLDPVAATAIVTPPAGASGQTSTVTAYNADGQNSQLVQFASPATYSYGKAAAPAIGAISPSSLPAGAEAMVDITGSGFNFAPGLTTIGFGTSDVLVRRVFVLSPNHLQVDVSVAPGAALSNPDVSVISGFQVATAPAGFHIAAPVAGLPVAIPTLENALPGLTGAYAGAVVSLYGSNLTAPNSNPSVIFNGQFATLLYVSATQINLVIPSGLPSGPVTMSVSNGSVSAYALTVNIDPTPASIGAVQNASGSYIDATHAAHPGDQLIVDLNNFASPGQTIALGRVQVGVGGVLHNVTAITNPAPAVYQVTFSLNANESSGATQPLIVYLDGLSSFPTTIPVQ